MGPYNMDELAVALGATCTLTRTGQLGDSWENAVWSGFGQSFSIGTGYYLQDSSFTKSLKFVVQDGGTSTILPTLSSAIVCSAGEFPEEIGWSLSCSDGTTLSHSPGEDLPYIMEDLAVALGATCTLEMTDAAGDGREERGLRTSWYRIWGRTACVCLRFRLSW